MTGVAPLLVELLTEELPPRSLERLALAFRDALLQALREDGFVADPGEARHFATPRRLAVRIERVRRRTEDRPMEVQGPSLKSALDAGGKPTQALLGFAKKQGVSPERLERKSTPKGEVFVHRAVASGKEIDASLGSTVEAAIRKLPAPKLMRWGTGEAEFVRPVHAVVMLHGERLVRGTVLGLESGRTTRGHRFMGESEIEIPGALQYESALREKGMVIADFAERRAEIEGALKREAARAQGELGDYADLLEEVTALVEYPCVYAGRFDEAFLEVPQECLILTMRQNQKYFPLFDRAGRLLSRFLIVSNMRVSDPRHIIAGNERVVRPRLEDARFFYNQDRKVRLEARVPQLAKMVYHGKLGSQLERVERIQLGAGAIARMLGADAAAAERAAWLSKADLLTGMVGEFPELQGIMGRYYARHDGEPPEVADTIEAHYRPRFAGDALPERPVAAAVALADKLDALVGIFGIGLAPSGDKDPFGLRRQALGVLRILAEQELALDLSELLQLALKQFAGAARLRPDLDQIFQFIMERLRSYLRERSYAFDEIEAVVSQDPTRIDLVAPRLEAVRSFRRLPEAESLAAANKRIRNILKKAPASQAGPGFELLVEPAEKELYQAVQRLEPETRRAVESRAYGEALRRLAGVRGSVDAFFEKVLVMAEDPKLRDNRLALLRRLDVLMNLVADISKLAA